MKKLLLFTLLIASTVIMAQPQLSWRFNNAQLVNGNTQLQFDVEVMADAPGYFFGLSTVAIDYSSLAFGTNIVPTNVVLERGVLMLEESFLGGFKYDVQGVANTFPTTMSASIQQVSGGNPNALVHTEIPTTWGQFFIYTITIDAGAAPGAVSGIVFNEVLMNGQCFYITTGGTNTPVVNPNLYDNNGLDLFEIVPAGVGTPGLWTGDFDSNWFDGLNWDDGNVPDGIDVTIPELGGKAVYPVILGGIATTGTLTIAANAQLTIAPQAGLTTNGLFTNDGTFLIQSEGGAGYAGTYIDNGGIAGSGMFQFDRNVLCSGTAPGVADPLGWHYLSAPFDGFSTDDLPDYFVNAWDQGTGMWVQYYMDPVAFPCTPYPTTTLNVLDAWSINWDNTYPDPLCPLLDPGTGNVVEFMTNNAGSVHTGGHNAALYHDIGMYQEWNMVGNPYPSGLEMSTLGWGPNTVQGAAYYDGCTGNYVYWSILDGPYVMSPTLGFFVEVTAADNLAMDNTDRAHNAGWFWKDEVTNLLTLQASGNDKSDVLRIHFADNVTAGFDLAGDFHKLIATTEGLPQIYTTVGDEKLAVNALPATEVVPMGFMANGSGTYTIEAIETSDFGIVNLEDKVTGQIIDLLTSNYTFEYTEGSNPDRFNIHFKSTGIGENEASLINIWSGDSKIFVQTPVSARGDIVVYNMMGQEVVRTDIEPGLNTIYMNEVNANFVVKVFTSYSAVTGKVFVR